MSAAEELATSNVVPRTFECHECGLRCRIGALPSGVTASCTRCGATLLKIVPDSLDRSLALTVTGLVLIVFANTLPFMSLSIQGRVQEADLVTGCLALLEQGLWSLAAFVAFTTIVAPSIKLAATLYVLLGLKLPRPLPGLPLVFRWLEKLHPWSMIEVYLLGVFVAYVKLVDLATIEIGPAFWSLVALMVLMIGIDLCLNSELVWREMERRGLVRLPDAAGEGPFVLCESCGLLGAAGPHGSPCVRCGAARHARKPESISRTWALTLTALILYIPANQFPIMTVVSFGSGESDTIISGVKHLFQAGMWPLALLVFFASIAVPVLKVAGIALLLFTTQRRSHWRLRDRTLLYRVVESVGRWSMIDIFMLSILAGLVRLGSIATIEPGVGAISFAGVVITTMFAASSFDPRLMWDAAGENR
jgi:paraquat-inducible protein A